jgi:hypothetical protein
MRRPLYLTLLGALALAASGCGESSPKQTTTTVASAPTGTTTVQTATPSPSGGPTASSGGATGPSGGSTGPSGGHAGKQTAAEAATAAEARVLRIKQAAERKIARIRARYRSEGVAEKKAQLEATKRAILKKRKPYPQYVQAKFTASCEAASGSPSQCACILKKQEFSSGEVGLSLGGLLALEQFLKQGKTIQEVARPHPPQRPVSLPGDVGIHLEQCLGIK